MAAAMSKRAPRQPVQQELFRRGGKRKGADRKSRGARAGVSHRARPEVRPQHALHVVMRVVPAVGSLRRRAMYKAMHAASIVAAVREWFRIVHISLQRSHVHMIVEAETKAALARGMQGFRSRRPGTSTQRWATSVAVFVGEERCSPTATISR